MQCSRALSDDLFGNLLSIRINYSSCNCLAFTCFLAGKQIFPTLIPIFKHSVVKSRQKRKVENKRTAFQKALTSNS